ncbi:D-ribose pyranase [Shouchella shacheensis]|uniref:D-ribose pyranase n=1 Tax=Shouchella shacheensis TaxID=1649580 RepID=UPI0007403CFF|nr:D-ribose pyranase [Shouchella shacheensis]
MKKSGILNRDISRVLATLGHTDHIVIADCGLPIPAGIECIDVSIKLGTPSFMDVLAEVMLDMEVEACIAATEVEGANPLVHQILERQHMPVYYLPHVELKAETKKAKAFIRTGEGTPFANVILRAGVIF